MAMKFIRTISVLAMASVAGAAPGVSFAQGIPTVQQVGDNLDLGCATTPTGALLDQDACMAQVMASIGVAGQYYVLSEEAQQEDIGYLLCQLGIEQPRIQQAIFDLIIDSNNLYLLTGCSRAFEILLGKFPPVISKA